MTEEEIEQVLRWLDKVDTTLNQEEIEHQEMGGQRTWSSQTVQQATAQAPAKGDLPQIETPPPVPAKSPLRQLKKKSPINKAVCADAKDRPGSTTPIPLWR